MPTDDFEKSLCGILDRISIGVYRSSIEGKLIAGNRALATIFGFDSVDEMRLFPLIRLYRSKPDRGELIQAVLRRGMVENRRIGFRGRDGHSLWCSVTACAVPEPDGTVHFIDGTVQDVTEAENRIALAGQTDRALRPKQEFSFTLDASGKVKEIDATGAQVFRYGRQEMIGNLLSAYVAPKYRKLFDGFLGDVIEKKSDVEGILIFNDSTGRARHVEVHARVEQPENGRRQVRGIGRDITKTVESQQERLNRERFQGVLEMAGGVVHRLNQPLTVVTNLVNELASETGPEETTYEKLKQVQEQVKKLNDIAKKIGNVRKYKAMDYVAGVRIVDIDHAS